MRATTARAFVVRPAAILLVGALAACASPSSRYRSQIDDWQHSEPPAVAREDDALFAGLAELSRASLVAGVLERNPTVRAARHGWRAAIERFPQVTSLDDPMLGAGVAPLSIGSHDVDEAPRFDLSQRIPFPGKLRFRGEAALAEAEAASHDYGAVRLHLATMASLLYDDYYVAERSLAINADHVGLLEEFQRIASARYEAGEASQQDPIQAEVQLTHAIHRDIVLGTSRRIVAEQMNALLHRDPRAHLPPPPRRLDPPGMELEEASALVEKALATTPELAAADARVAAEASRVDLAQREYLPDVTLVGAYNGVMQEDDLRPFVGVQLSVPLQLGRRKAAVDEANARLERARSQRLAIEDDVRLSVHSGVERLDESHHIVHLYRDRLLPAARDQVSAARSGFESGRNSFLALIDAERNLLNVELGYEEALANLWRRRAELDRALGRTPGLDG